jgi:predicted kinase
MKFYYTKGYPGSGKSTLAKKMVAESKGTLVRVNRDDLRKAHSQWKRGKMNYTVEADVLKDRNRLIEEALAQGHDVINDDTNLSESAVRPMLVLAQKYKAEVICLDFTDPNSKHYVSLEECIKRDTTRDDSVGKDVILRMWNERVVKKVPKPEWSKELEVAWIFDIDGTLAHHEGLRSAYEEKYEVDNPDITVIAMLKALKQAGSKIIIVSGREGTEVGLEKTKNWLKQHDIPYDHFYMRNAKDRRSDTLVKKEIYETYIKGKYNILGVVDDRPKVIRMWEEQGLKVLKCGPGIEF